MNQKSIIMSQVPKKGPRDMYEEGTLLSLAYPLPRSLSNLNGLDNLQVPMKGSQHDIWQSYFTMTPMRTSALTKPAV